MAGDLPAATKRPSVLPSAVWPEDQNSMTSNNAYLDGRAKGLEWAQTRDDPLARPMTEEIVAAARAHEQMTAASDKLAFYSGFAEGAFELWFFQSIDVLDFPEELKPNRSNGWLTRLENRTNN
jgi:hypothetical protein